MAGGFLFNTGAAIERSSMFCWNLFSNRVLFGKNLVSYAVVIVNRFALGYDQLAL